jgi:hypothetical protein
MGSLIAGALIEIHTPEKDPAMPLSSVVQKQVPDLIYKE